MGRAMRPVASSYIASRHSKTENDQVKSKIISRGYYQAKTKHVSVKRVPIEHDVFVKKSAIPLEKRKKMPIKSTSIGIIASRPLFTEQQFQEAIPRVIAKSESTAATKDELQKSLYLKDFKGAEQITLDD